MLYVVFVLAFFVLVEQYTVFSGPKIVVKNLAKNLAKHLAKNLANSLVNHSTARGWTNRCPNREQ